jgi:hypothetical protein
MAVVERTQRWPEKLRRRWKPLAVVLAPACLLLVMLMTREQKKVIAPAPVAHPPVEATVETPARAPAPQPPIVRARRHVAKAPRVIASKGASLIRIETPDPDVVILLVGG